MPFRSFFSFPFLTISHIIFCLYRIISALFVTHNTYPVYYTYIHSLEITPMQGESFALKVRCLSVCTYSYMHPLLQKCLWYFLLLQISKYTVYIHKLCAVCSCSIVLLTQNPCHYYKHTSRDVCIICSLVQVLPRHIVCTRSGKLYIEREHTEKTQ